MVCVCRWRWHYLGGAITLASFILFYHPFEHNFCVKHNSQNFNFFLPWLNLMFNQRFGRARCSASRKHERRNNRGGLRAPVRVCAFFLVPCLLKSQQPLYIIAKSPLHFFHVFFLVHFRALPITRSLYPIFLFLCSSPAGAAAPAVPVRKAAAILS